MIQVEPALECNLECVMCPWTGMRPGQAVMTWDTFACLMPDLPLAEKVDLTGGGEPLTNPRLVDMVRAARASGCEVGFSTNGTLLHEARSRALIAAGLDWIGFSVDAASPVTYERIRRGASFATVDDNIGALNAARRELGAARPRVLLIFVLMYENYDELPAYIDQADRWGAAQVIVKNLDVITKDGDDRRRVFGRDSQIESGVCLSLAEAQRRARQHHIALRLYGLEPAERAVCELDPLRSVFVNWAGSVSRCITLAYAGSRVFDGRREAAPCLGFGNVTAAPLGQIWEEPAYREFRSAYTARVNCQRRAVVDALAGSRPDGLEPLPPAPAPCQTCYYLFGI